MTSPVHSPKLPDDGKMHTGVLGYSEGPAMSKLEEEESALDMNESTGVDRRDMRRLGRKQEMRRSFRSLSMLSFSVIVQATWEFILCSLTQGLTNGGLAGLTWSYIWTFVLFTPIVLSLAEMASMAPTSGGQYHWVSEFAPERYQKFLSYFAGWQSTLAWQAGNASGPFVTGALMQALIYVRNPSYEGTDWQESLLVIANVLLLLVVNVWGARFLPSLQNAFALLHVVFFAAIIISLWAKAPHASATQVFAVFENSSGFSNLGLSLCIGQISAIWGLIGSDAPAHMAEETRDASRSIPQAMIWGYISNGLMGVLLVVTVCFSLPDLDAALNDPSGYPFLYAFQAAVGTNGTIVLTICLLIVVFASNIAYLTSTGRETFAFARDNGLPFGRWLGAVHPRRQIPTNALIVTSAIAILLSLLNIGSSAAFNAIISLNTVALMVTYALSIGCVLWRRVAKPETLPPARWSLGRYGMACNAWGVVYSTWACFWAMWPPGYPVTLDTFNWAPVIFAGVTVVCVGMYWATGRRVYEGPAVLVAGKRANRVERATRIAGEE